MRVTELILDGFKSYPVRTSITGWDASFNAITGLNGSGKSNILDSICFVLGITNLTTVRAQNLLDLIYKRGQAGVTRASVTIVFDNSDTSKAPVGFEAMSEISVTRQISLNGTSKYLICGHRSTQSAVQNLFQSVQLNINNPNFLIMQGKITKVLNMRPAEILSMIEEAAGTSMFEEKKEKAVKTMARKEKRLDEIQELLREEITPKLDKLREEKRAFLEFQKKSSELERLNKLVVASDWMQLESRKSKGIETIKSTELELKSTIASQGRMEGEISRMETDGKEITKRRDEELAKGGKVQKLEQEQKEFARALALLKAKVDIGKSTIVDEEFRSKELESNVKELIFQRDSKAASSVASAESFAALKATYDTSTATLKASEDLLQTLLTGISSSSEESTSSGFMGQLATAKSLVSSLGTEAERAKARVEHLTKELKDKEPKAKTAAMEGKGLLAELESARKELDKLDAALGQLGWDEAKEGALRNRKDVEGKAVRDLYEKRDAVKSQLVALEFDFASPSPSFDRSRVKGLIASLISLASEHHHASTALEICAGGRLFNVVVESADVGKALLEKGQLRKRVTIIPIDKISPNIASSDTLKTVNKVSDGHASLALDLIDCDDDVRRAMEYVFGNTLICPDPETAKSVTFNDKIRMKSVTFEGDVYDPSGTLSGGSQSKSGGILIRVQELKGVERELEARKRALSVMEKEWEKARGEMDHFKAAKKARDLKVHEVGLLEERVGESNATRIIAEVEAARANIAELNTMVAASKVKQKAATAECKRIEKEMDEFKTNRGSKLAQIKTDITKKKAEVGKYTASVKNLQKEVQTSELELEQMEQDILALATERKEAEATLSNARLELQAFVVQAQSSQKELDSIESKIFEETRRLSAFKEELDELDRAMKSKKQEIADGELKIKVMQQDIERIKKEQKGAVDAVVRLEKEYSWITDEHQTFGREGSPYDFNGLNMNDIKKKCQSLEDDQQGMRKKVNPKVLSMIDSVEKKEKDLLLMYKQVLKDKSKIEETVEKLDEYKKEALQKTWEIVNAEFGNIFAELLPGNFSKLQPPEGMDITQGLEVKVRLGSVWKASLTELSGGQRSLIALSLIMSLLHFKPAPMYILDEIDAALDLSHTENIGRLFRTRFTSSQFIVISLKDGLFSNANVLFRTRFRDGTSIVERTVQRSSSGLYEGDRENEGLAQGGKGKAKSSTKRIATAVTA